MEVISRRIAHTVTSSASGPSPDARALLRFSDRLGEVLAEELLGEVRVARLDRREQLRVLGGDLDGTLVVGAKLDHAEQDLRLDAGVGAGDPRALGGVDHRPVKASCRARRRRARARRRGPRRGRRRPGGRPRGRARRRSRAGPPRSRAPRADGRCRGCPGRSSTVTWTPRCGSRRSIPSEISIWVAARKEWRAIPSRSANSASRSRLPGSSSPSRISSRSTFAAASTVETVFRRTFGVPEPAEVASICHIIPQLDKDGF